MRQPLPATLLVAAGLLAGCASNAYFDTLRNTAPGGKLETDTRAAEERLRREQAERDRVQRQNAVVQGQISADERQIQTLKASLVQQDRKLAQALKDRKLTKARHDELKRQLDDLSADASSAELQNRGSAMGAADPKVEAAKKAQLDKLEERRRTLESALSDLASK